MISANLNLLSSVISFWLLLASQAWGQELVGHNNSLRNISLYPVCAQNSDCEGEQACFQYMCYPWKHSTGFRWCNKDSDCTSLALDEEGDGKDGSCFMHQDRENISFGICLKKE